MKNLFKISTLLILGSSFLLSLECNEGVGDDDSDGQANSDWQPLDVTADDDAPNANEFTAAGIFNSGDVVKYNDKFYIAQNPEKNGERCWNIPF